VYLEHDAADRALVARCLEGDSTAFEALVERYHRVLFTVAVRMLGDRDDANDATQNTFLKVHRSLGRFDANRRFFSWIYRILVNECLNLQRAHHPHEPLDADVAGTDNPGARLEASDERRQVQAAILDLSAEQRAVIVLRHFADMSYDEISEALNVPVRTVRSRLHSARRRLIELLAGTRAHG
jgi:RNA polymerase sigma-70 factor (ECF subfamily)